MPRRAVLVDGRPGYTPTELEQMVSRFTPWTVPVVAAHDEPLLLGYLDHVWLDGGRDLRFSGEIETSPDICARLRRDGIPVSIEVMVRRLPRPPHPGRSHEWQQSHFRGALADGCNLVAVALSANPAAVGSLMWSDDELADPGIELPPSRLSRWADDARPFSMPAHRHGPSHAKR